MDAHFLTPVRLICCSSLCLPDCREGILERGGEHRACSEGRGFHYSRAGQEKEEGMLLLESDNFIGKLMSRLMIMSVDY